MNNVKVKLLTIGAFSAAAILVGANVRLFAQQVSAQKEVIRPKESPLKFDKALGASTAQLGQGRLHQVDVTLVEIPPGEKLAPHKHLAEEMILIISGKGYTLMWNGKADKKEKYEWGEGDLLSPSLNAWHQHINASPDTAARYLSITTTPLTENVFKNNSLLSSTDFSFDERWKKSLLQKKPEYVGNESEGPDAIRMSVGHFLPDLRNRTMANRGERMWGITIDPEGDMAGNQILEMEVREFPRPDSDTPDHRHFWETVYYILKGDGSAALQREGEPNRTLEWKEGDLFLVEANEYHIHRSRGVGGRFLQIKPSGYFRHVGLDKYVMQDRPQ